MVRIPVAWPIVVVAGAAVVLAACTVTHGPLWGPDSPRNGAGEVVEPDTGTILPGYPTGGAGGGGGMQ
jgi:hypothetical protein